MVVWSVIFLFALFGSGLIAGENQDCEDSIVDSEISISSDETCDEGDKSCKVFEFDANNLPELERDVAHYIEKRISELQIIGGPGEVTTIPGDATTNAPTVATTSDVTPTTPPESITVITTTSDVISSTKTTIDVPSPSETVKISDAKHTTQYDTSTSGATSSSDVTSSTEAKNIADAPFAGTTSDAISSSSTTIDVPSPAETAEISDAKHTTQYDTSTSGATSSSDVTFSTEAKNISGCPLFLTYHFPNANQKTDYVIVKTSMTQLTDVSICAWVTPLPGKKLTGALFSYYHPSSSTYGNALLIYFPVEENDKDSMEVFVNDQVVKVDNVVISEKSQVCVVISAKCLGYIKTYIKSKKSEPRSEAASRLNWLRPIPGEGTLVIGQNQDSRLGGFNATQAFSGTVENLLVWKRILKEDEIKDIFDDECKCAVGDYIIDLSKSAVDVRGNVTATYPNDCGG